MKATREVGRAFAEAGFRLLLEIGEVVWGWPRRVERCHWRTFGRGVCFGNGRQRMNIRGLAAFQGLEKRALEKGGA
jgi:hypothetical protein